TLVARPGLLLGYVVSTRAYPMTDPLHGQLLGNEQYVQNNRVARGVRGVDQVQLGGVRKDGFGDEGPAQFDQFRSGVRGYCDGVVGVCGGVAWPAPFGDLVGIDERASRQ